MTASIKTADVVIIGAGVAGMAVARALVEKQKVDVIVVEKEPTYGCGSTGRAIGAVKRQLHTCTLTKIADAGSRDILSFKERYDVEVECEIPGYLSLVSSPKEYEKVLKEDKIHKRAGLTTEILDPAEIARRWSFVAVDDLLAGSYSPHDPNVDPFSVATALYKGARRAGASFLFNAEVTGIMLTKEGSAAGVETTRGAVSAPALVNAAGPWAAELCLKAGMRKKPPMVPRRRQIWQIAQGLDIPRRIPIIIDVDAPFYLRPYRELFLFSLMDEDEIKLTDNEPPFDWELILQIEDRVTGRIPMLLEASFGKGWAGWRTLTPDDAPVLGKVEATPGFYMAAGFGGHGIALAPFCGKMIASEILGEKTHEPALEEFRIERF